MVPAPLFHSDDLRRWRSCERRFWLARHRLRRGESASASEPAPEADMALRASFPHADTVAAPQTPSQWVQAMRHTLDCLDSDAAMPEGWAILGACLTSEDRAQVRIDVLTAGEHGLRLFKVRHATVGDEADVDTVALWTHVAARCGFAVQGAGLLLIDTDFVYPGHGCYAGLFREVDLRPVLGSRPVAQWLHDMRDCEHGPEPAATPGPHCHQGSGCEFAASCKTCAPPPRSRRAVPDGALRLDPAVAALAQTWPHLHRCLRFDTIGMAVPVWSGTRPYQTLPFQWSCAVQAADGSWSDHQFLAHAQGGDPRRAFALSLLQVLGDGGAVLAYNAGFERNRIRELAQWFEDLAPALEALLPRIVDLYQVLRSHQQDPVKGGSWSFRAIAQAVAPDMDLELRLNPALDAEHEGSAQSVFALMHRPGQSAAVRQACRQALRDHGQLETVVLRRLLALFDRAGE
jgi:Domain of unknown function(DUF2779)